MKDVEGKVHTNGMENFWTLLKRAINGTYVSIEPFHPDAYLDEQTFRFNNWKDNDNGRFNDTVSGIVGRRLTYAELTGKVDTSEQWLMLRPGRGKRQPKEQHDDGRQETGENSVSAV